MAKGRSFWKANDDDNMKFNAVVGNPPYQEEGISTRKAPIYHLFYDIAFNLSDIVTLITPGRFLFRAGQTPAEWMDRILADRHIMVVDYFQKSTDVFPTVDIKGGVAITLRDARQDFGEIGFFSPFPELVGILQKVSSHKDFKRGEFAAMVSSQGLYKFTDEAFASYPQIYQVQGKGTAAKITSNSLENLPELFFAEKPAGNGNYVQIIGRIDGKRAIRWVKRSLMQPVETLDAFKVLVPEANGTGAIGEVLSTPIIGMPIMAHTDTFLSIGNFAGAEETGSCLNYIRTKFARTMLGTLKATQHNPRDTWANVPMQNFTPSSDIDWSKPVADIDRQLYAKYHLTDEEIAFIERMIKPM